jgi:2-methylfumaryl-CoA isomerase
MRVVEGASFVAAPLCGLTFVQLGADVIRFDPVRGGPDFRRWPLAPNGISYYWEGLNKGKRSVAIDLARDEGRELAAAIATAPGEAGGMFVTNYPAKGFLAHDKLAVRRPDLISVRITGSSDGKNAVDYTVNCATGYPAMTGPVNDPEPVNHILPAWDVASGLFAAVSLLAAERERRMTGRGREIEVPLSNVAFATLATLGNVAEMQLGGDERPRIGNAVYGTFGRDFVTRDGRRMMVVAITQRQWSGLLLSLEMESEIRVLEATEKVSFAEDDGLRFVHREAIFAIVEKKMAAMNFAMLAKRFDKNAVCWGPYQTVREALRDDARLSAKNPLFQMQEHPSGAPYLTAGFPPEFRNEARGRVARAPRLGQHTDEVLAEVVGLSAAKIGELHDAGIVAGPNHE